MTRDARGWFHAAAWLGLAATAYTNYQAAPVAELRVGYLAVPVLLTCVSEGLIRKWAVLPPRARGLLAGLAFALVCVSYEHFVHMILTAAGTAFAAWVGGAVIDLTIFGCVLATCVLSVPETGKPETDILVLPETGNRKPETGTTILPVSGFPELEPETGNLPEAAPELSVPVSVLIPVGLETGTTTLPVSPVAVPVFAEPPATEVDGPTVPEAPFRDASVADFAPTPDAPHSPAPVSGGRAAKHAQDMQDMYEAFGLSQPTTTEIMHALHCGGSRAERLREAYRTHLEMLSEE